MSDNPSLDSDQPAKRDIAGNDRSVVHIKVIEAGQFETEVLASPAPVVLDFFSTECPPCEALAPKFEALADKFSGQVRFLKIFRQGNRDLATKLKVSSSPTLIFFEGGKEVGERLTGEIQRSALKAALEVLQQ